MEYLLQLLKQKMFDVQYARSQFPGLSSELAPSKQAPRLTVFMDNAGGSQTAQQSITRITEYLSHSNVQLGATYSVSRLSSSRVMSGFEAAQVLINSESKESVIFGSSTTQLMCNLASAFETSLDSEVQVKRGDEIIVTNVDHEANVGCWERLAMRAGGKLKVWKFRENSSGEIGLFIEDLDKLLSEKTKLVCVTHCSNILGSIMPIKQISNLVHKKVEFLSYFSLI